MEKNNENSKLNIISNILLLIGITLISILVQFSDSKVNSHNQEVIQLQNELINSNGFSTNLGIISIISKLENNTLEELFFRSGMIDELYKYDYTKNTIMLPKKNTPPVCWKINCSKLKEYLYIIQIVFICILLGINLVRFKRD